MNSESHQLSFSCGTMNSSFLILGNNLFWDDAGLLTSRKGVKISQALALCLRIVTKAVKQISKLS